MKAIEAVQYLPASNSVWESCTFSVSRACVQLEKASCKLYQPVFSANMLLQALGPIITDAMVAATSATHTDSQVPADPGTSCSDVGLPDPAVIPMQAACISVLGQELHNGQKHWQKFGLRAFEASMSTLSHVVCLTLGYRDGYKHSAYSTRATPEDLSLTNLAPHLSMTRETLQA